MKNIFVVEDSRIVSELLAFEMEESFQADVTCFSSGKELMENLLKNPDLIILDYYLDNGRSTVTGLEVLKQLKKVKPEIPVIVFSGQHDMKTAVDLINQGAVDYIDKSSETFLEELCKSVKDVMSVKDLERGKKKYKREINGTKKQILFVSAMSVVLLLILLLA